MGTEEILWKLLSENVLGGGDNLITSLIHNLYLYLLWDLYDLSSVETAFKIVYWLV